MKMKRKGSPIQSTVRFLPISAILFLFVTACNPQDKDEHLLKEAAAIHEEAVRIEEQIESRIAELVQYRNALQIQGRTLTSGERALITGIDSVESSLRFWKEHHVEVPGFEHEGHHHDHDHSHDHGPSLKLSPEDMLLVQQEFRDSLRALEKHIAKLGKLVSSDRKEIQ